MFANNQTTAQMQQNAQALAAELYWLSALISTRIALFFGDECDYNSVAEVTPPELPAGSTYASFLHQHQLTRAERCVLALSLAPHVQPEVLDPLYLKNATYDKVFTQFGGWYDRGHSAFMPTLETAAFLLAQGDLATRFQLRTLFDADHTFMQLGVLDPHTLFEQTPVWSRLLRLSEEYVDLFTEGVARPPDFGMDFPAKRVSTALEWEDLVLNPNTREQVLELKDWVDYSPVLLNGWGLGRSISKGYKCLFYGPPGTGKTLTASLLGKSVQRDVYRIDLSMVVSKYIGETEKNLAKVFNKAQHKNWILFFDEADALFGKRTESQSSNDRHANQEVAYLLQRIEDYNGLAILATNLKDHLDEAFTRRFHSMIYFPTPTNRERLRLWRQGFSAKTPLQADIDLKKIADKYELSGATIMNVIRYASIQAAKHPEHVIELPHLLQGIKKELRKEGISLL